MSATKTLQEVKEHNDGKSCWVVIHDKIYDVTAFMEEHPGGEEVLLEVAGQDASEQFEDVGHSVDARELLAEYYIADLDEKDRVQKPVKETANNTDASNGLPMMLIAASLLAIGAAVGYMLYMNKT